MHGVAAGCASLFYVARVWPGATLFICVLIGRILHWPGTEHLWSYLYWLGMALPCVLLAWHGDDLIDIGGKALVDLRRGWPDLWSGQLERHADLEYVPAKIVPAEGSQPIIILPGGMRAFLPTMGDVYAYWARIPSAPDPSKPLPKQMRHPRAYPLASYRNYIFLPFAPNKATPEVRFQLFHEIGHALFSRSFPAIGQVQTWPCLLLLTILTLAVTDMDWITAWPLGAVLILWQSVTLLRTMPSYERERFSELWADFYAIVHLRGSPEIRPLIEKMIAGMRSSKEPAKIERAEDLEVLLNTVGPSPTDQEGAQDALSAAQLGSVHKRLVSKGSEHPTLLILVTAVSLVAVGYQLASVRPEPMLAFAFIYVFVPFMNCFFGTSRRNARQGARADRFLRDRQPPGETQDAVPLVFS